MHTNVDEWPAAVFLFIDEEAPAWNTKSARAIWCESY
jgi:hypothetical protein